MLAMTVLALTGGALLGTRFNVWALPVCLGATVVLMTGAMLLASLSVTSTMTAAFVVVTGAETGYLAGTYATQAGVFHRMLRATFFPFDGS
jgi:hypothetical protein